MATGRSRTRDIDGYSVTTTQSAATSAVAAAMTVRHWVFSRLEEHSKYRDYLSTIFVTRRRHPPEHAKLFIQSDVSDFMSKGKNVQLEVGQVLSRLDIVCRHYLWPYNARPFESIGQSIPESEAELLSNSKSARRVRGHAAHVAEASDHDEAERVDVTQVRLDESQHLGAPAETVAPITSFGGSLRGAVAVFHTRLASSIHEVCHTPSAPLLHDTLYASLASLLLELLAVLPVDQLQGHAQSPQRQSSPGRSVDPVSPQQGSTSPVSRSPSQAIGQRTHGRSLSPASLSARATPISSIVCSTACMEVIAACTVYVYWEVLRPWHEEWERRHGPSHCAACNVSTAEDPNVQGQDCEHVDSGDQSASPSVNSARPSLPELAGRITCAWAEVEKAIRIQHRRAAAQCRPLVLLSIRTVIELYLQERYPWFYLLQAVAAAVDRQFPSAASAGAPGDTSGVVQYVCSSTALWRDIDRVTSQLLDPSRLGSHMAAAESSESARRLSAQVRQELDRSRIQASRKEIAARQGVITSVKLDTAQSAATAYSPKQWMVATSPGTASWTRDRSNPQVRRLLNSHGTMNRVQTSPVSPEQGWQISLAKIRDSYAQGRRPVPGLRERLELLAGGPRASLSPSPQKTATAAGSLLSEQARSSAGGHVHIDGVPFRVLLSAAAAEIMQDEVDVAIRGSAYDEGRQRPQVDGGC